MDVRLAEPDEQLFYPARNNEINSSALSIINGLIDMHAMGKFEIAWQGTGRLARASCL